MVERPASILQAREVDRPMLEMQLCELRSVVSSLCAPDLFQWNLHAVNVVDHVIARIALWLTLYAHKNKIVQWSPNTRFLLKFALSATLQGLPRTRRNGIPPGCPYHHFKEASGQRHHTFVRLFAAPDGKQG